MNLISNKIWAIGLAAAVAIGVLLLVTSESQTSSPVETDGNLTNQSNLPIVVQSKNQTGTTPLAANETQAIPHIGQFITANYAYTMIPDKFFNPGQKQYKDSYLRIYPPQFEYLKFTGNVTAPRHPKPFESEFGLNATSGIWIQNKTYPAFGVYSADLNSTTIQKFQYTATFDEYRGHLFVNSTESRYVWAVIPTPAGPGENTFYVDARTGQVIGFFAFCRAPLCPICVVQGIYLRMDVLGFNTTNTN